MLIYLFITKLTCFSLIVEKFGGSVFVDLPNARTRFFFRDHPLPSAVAHCLRRENRLCLVVAAPRKKRPPPTPRLARRHTRRRRQRSHCGFRRRKHGPNRQRRLFGCIIQAVRRTRTCTRKYGRRREGGDDTSAAGREVARNTSSFLRTNKWSLGRLAL